MGRSRKGKESAGVGRPAHNKGGCLVSGVSVKGVKSEEGGRFLRAGV